VRSGRPIRQWLLRHPGVDDVKARVNGLQVDVKQEVTNTAPRGVLFSGTRTHFAHT
jgi:hypothetical protein